MVGVGRGCLEYASVRTPAAEVAVDVTHETMPTWDDAAADHAVATVVAVLSSVCGVRVELQARRGSSVVTSYRDDVRPCHCRVAATGHIANGEWNWLAPTRPTDPQSRHARSGRE